MKKYKKQLFKTASLLLLILCFCSCQTTSDTIKFGITSENLIQIKGEPTNISENYKYNYTDTIICHYFDCTEYYCIKDDKLIIYGYQYLINDMQDGVTKFNAIKNSLSIKYGKKYYIDTSHEDILKDEAEIISTHWRNTKDGYVTLILHKEYGLLLGFKDE